MVVTAVVALLFALLGSIGVNWRGDRIDEARVAGAALLEVQDIRVAVLQADAIASQQYLVGGQEDPSARQAYLVAIDSATTGMLKLTPGGDRAGVDPVTAAGTGLATYIGLVEQARANNRQGFPLGAAYQRQANALIVGQVVPNLRTIERSLRADVDRSLAGAHRAGALLHVAGWPLLILLVGGGAWLAVRFRRTINVPLAAGTLLVAVVLLVAAASQASAMSDADGSVDGPLAAADLLAQARAGAFDARSQESLTLVFRGNGQPYEVNWIVSSGVVSRALDAACARGGPCDLAAGFQAYAADHQSIRELDDGGDWDAAVRVATGQQPAASGDRVPEQFAAFAELAQQSSAAAAVSADGALADASSTSGALVPWVALAGLAAGVLVLAGYGQRLREYR